MPVGWAVVVVAQWAAIIALAAVLLGVMRQLAPYLELQQEEPAQQVDLIQQGPEVGAELPAFAARDEDGQPVGGERLRRGPGVLLFLSAGCGPCVGLAEDLKLAGADQVARLSAALTVLVDAEGVRILGLPAWVRVLTVSTAESLETLGIRARPFAVAVGAAGTVRRKQLVNTLAQVSDLAAAARSPALPLM